METRDSLARQHRRVVDEWASDTGDWTRNVLAVALRHEVQTLLVPGLLPVDALLLGADAGTLGRLPQWLERV